MLHATFGIFCTDLGYWSIFRGSTPACNVYTNFVWPKDETGFLLTQRLLERTQIDTMDWLLDNVQCDFDIPKKNMTDLTYRLIIFQCKWWRKHRWWWRWQIFRWWEISFELSSTSSCSDWIVLRQIVIVVLTMWTNNHFQFVIVLIKSLANCTQCGLCKTKRLCQ